ncbi:MAG: hypothetical protein PHU69_02845 [Fermentimonas sp.]|nr:hypothetical protein [Fermentimonas sp.]
MKTEQFNSIIENQYKRCTDILITKAKEYSTVDRLYNFKVAAGLQMTTPINALAGMLAKHTVSIYDMCRSGQLYSEAMWDEKITDHINYLFLLKALTIEEAEGRTKCGDEN